VPIPSASKLAAFEIFLCRHCDVATERGRKVAKAFVRLPRISLYQIIRQFSGWPPGIGARPSFIFGLAVNSQSILSGRIAILNEIMRRWPAASLARQTPSWRVATRLMGANASLKSLEDQRSEIDV
jgi:hypothetical protein